MRIIRQSFIDTANSKRHRSLASGSIETLAAPATTLHEVVREPRLGRYDDILDCDTADFPDVAMAGRDEARRPRSDIIVDSCAQGFLETQRRISNYT